LEIHIKYEILNMYEDYKKDNKKDTYVFFHNKGL